jgi:hypothetical protein
VFDGIKPDYFRLKERENTVEQPFKLAVVEVILPEVSSHTAEHNVGLRGANRFLDKARQL